MTRLSVPDMTCGHCKASVEAAIARVDAGATVRVDLDAHTVEVDSAAPPAALIAALDEVGFPATAA
jgi:copper chaperone